MNAEIQVLETLIKTCRAIRSPKRSRLDLVPPAANWEMVFTKRLHELKRAEAPQPTIPPLNETREPVAA